MIFSTFKFIAFFLPVTFFVYYALNRLKYHSIAKIWLVVCSLYFYSQGSPAFFPFFVCSITGNYIVGLKLISMEGNQSSQKKWLLAIGLLGNVALLGYYKYTDFFIENYNALTGAAVPLKHIVLPIGISFFTFQLIAFLVDCYRAEMKQYDFVNYLLFITFFPQLIVGPIIHHSEVVPQFENRENLKLNPDHIALGLFMFSIGCAKKILLADPMTTDAQRFFDALPANAPLLQSWFCSMEYTVSYYFDLSGYADMAIGLGWLFNIAIPHNFDSPYKARNFQDYWRRWHMTLSRFLNAYIFRSVYRKDIPWRSYYVATMVTFFVSGFWHGAGWTFVAWGIANGILVCIASCMRKKGYSFPFWIAFPLTVIGVVLCRVLFVANSFAEVGIVFKGMVNFASLGASPSAWLSSIIAFIREQRGAGVRFAFAVFVCWFLPNSKSMGEKFKPSWKTMLFAAVLMTLCTFEMNKVVQFLYFQF